MKEMRTTSLRFGYVAEYDPSRHMARVYFPDMQITSYWLPVLTHNSLKNHDETHLDIGEHVACMMSGDGAEMGVILGAFYDDNNPPPVGEANIRAVTFDDNTRISYDRKNHELLVDSSDTITLVAKTITLSADSIHITDGITLSGNITLAGRISLSGEVSCPGYCRCS